MVAAALIGAHIHPEAAVVIVDHALGGIHIEIVEEEALLEHTLIGAGAPQGVGVGQTDKLTVGIGKGLIVIGIRFPGQGIQGVIVLGGGIGGLFNAHDAAGLIGIFAHHVHVQRGDDLGLFIGMAVQPQGSQIHLVAPQEGDGALRPGNGAAVHHLLQSGGQAQQGGNAGGIVVGAGLLHMGADDDPLIGLGGALDLGHGHSLALAAVRGVIHGIGAANADVGGIYGGAVGLLQQLQQSGLLIVGELPLHNGLAGGGLGGGGFQSCAGGIPGRVNKGLQDVAVFISGGAVVIEAGGGHHGNSAGLLGQGKGIAERGIRQDDLAGEVGIGLVHSGILGAGIGAALAADSAHIHHLAPDAYGVGGLGAAGLSEAAVPGQVAALVQLGLLAVEHIDAVAAGVLLGDPLPHVVNGIDTVMLFIVSVVGLKP